MALMAWGFFTPSQTVVFSRSNWSMLYVSGSVFARKYLIQNRVLRSRGGGKAPLRYDRGSTPAMSFASIPEAIEDFRAGRMLVVADDEDRENEGDLTVAAE